MKKALIFLMIMAGAAQAMKGQAGDKDLVGKKRDHQEAQDRGEEHQEEGSQTRKRDQKRERKSNVQEEHSSLDEASEGQGGQDQMGLFNPLDQRAGVPQEDELIQGGGVSQEVQHDMMENNTVRGAPDLGPGGRSLGDKTDEERALQEAMAMNEALMREDARREAEEAEKIRQENQRQAQGLEIIDTSSVPSSSAQMSQQEKEAKRAEFVKRAPIGSNEGFMKEIFQFLPTNQASRIPLNKYHVEKGLNKPMEYQQHLKFTNNFNQAKLDDIFHTVQQRAEGMNPVVSLDLSTARLNGRSIVLDTLLPYAQDLPPTLRSIHIGDTIVVDRPVGPFIPLLSRMTGLQSLTILNQDNAQELQALASALPKMQNLGELSLFNSRFGDEAVRALAPAFSQMPNLARLSLPFNRIGAAGMQALATALAQMPNLNGLFLSGNQIGDAGMQALALVLPQMQNLRELSLSDNQIGAAGMQTLALVLPQMQNLRELSLPENQIGDAGMQALAPALAQMDRLSDVILRSNRIGDTGARALEQAFANKPQTQSIPLFSLQFNNVSDQAARDLIRVRAQRFRFF